MTINFLPDSDLNNYSSAIAEYQSIWNEYGDKIIRVWEEMSGLQFRENYINAIVFDEAGPSHSHPLSLRANLEHERKLSVLIHELGHRLLFKRMDHLHSSLENHKTLYLVLFNVLESLFDTEFASRVVEWDKNLPRPEYKEAWEWALSISPADRFKIFQERTVNKEPV